MQCKQVTKGRDAQVEQMIRSITAWQLDLIAPKNFETADPDNYVKRIELSFENVCTALEELGVKDPAELTVFQFYNKVVYFEKKKTKQQTERRR